MAMRLAARLLPGWECITAALVVETPALRLSASDLDAVPPEFAPLLGRKRGRLQGVVALGQDGIGPAAASAPQEQFRDLFDNCHLIHLEF